MDESVLTFSEIKAIATGNSLVKEKMEVDNEVARLRMLKAEYNTQKYTLQDDFTFRYPNLIQNGVRHIEMLIKDIEKRDMTNREIFSIELGGKYYEEKEIAGTILKELCRKIQIADREEVLGNFCGFEISAKKEVFSGLYTITLHHHAKHSFQLGDSGTGNIQRMDNVLGSMAQKIKKLEENIENYKRNMAEAKQLFEKPFLHEDILTSKVKRQSEINMKLDLDKDTEPIVGAGVEEENEMEQEEVSAEY